MTSVDLNIEIQEINLVYRAPWRTTAVECGSSLLLLFNDQALYISLSRLKLLPRLDITTKL